MSVILVITQFPNNKKRLEYLSIFLEVVLAIEALLVENNKSKQNKRFTVIEKLNNIKNSEYNL